MFLINFFIIQDFKFSLIYQLLEDPYPEIQTLSLCVIGQLISKSKDDELHEVFRQSNGLQLLLDFLNVTIQNYRFLANI